MHDTKIGQILQQVELTATVTDKTAMKSVMTDEAKIKAAEPLAHAKPNDKDVRSPFYHICRFVPQI